MESNQMTWSTQDIHGKRKLLCTKATKLQVLVAENLASFFIQG